MVVKYWWIGLVATHSCWRLKMLPRTNTVSTLIKYCLYLQRFDSENYFSRCRYAELNARFSTWEQLNEMNGNCYRSRSRIASVTFPFLGFSTVSSHFDGIWTISLLVTYVTTSVRNMLKVLAPLPSTQANPVSSFRTYSLHHSSSPLTEDQLLGIHSI